MTHRPKAGIAYVLGNDPEPGSLKVRCDFRCPTEGFSRFMQSETISMGNIFAHYGTHITDWVRDCLTSVTKGHFGLLFHSITDQRISCISYELPAN